MPNTTQIGTEFERKIYNILKQAGFEVEWRTGMKSGDGGWDLTVYHKDCTVYIQCKDHIDNIGKGPVQALSGVLSKRSKRHFGIVVIPKDHEFAYGAHHEASTSPRPLKLSYENKIIEDLRELIRSSLETLKVEGENRIVMRMRSENEGVTEAWRLEMERRELESGNRLMRVQMENVMIVRENKLLRRDYEELLKRKGREMIFFFVLFFMVMYIIIYK